LAAVALSVTAYESRPGVGLLAKESREILNGKCGNNVEWTFDTSSLTMIINGTGQMNDYDKYSQPWSENIMRSMETVCIEEGVTSIGDRVFYGAYNLTSVSIPSSLEYIGKESFSECGKLSSVSIPEGVTAIGSGAFRNCNSLTSVAIPRSVSFIGDGSFETCRKLERIEVNSSNTVFLSDDGVLINQAKNDLILYPSGKTDTHYTIPSFITGIANSAFRLNKYLKSVTIPPSVEYIGDYAFYQCAVLESINIPEGVKSIGMYPFCDCKFKAIVIPSTVTSITNYMFFACHSLTSISYLGSTPPDKCGHDIFAHCDQLNSICVPSNYSSDSFCGQNITCKSSHCEALCSPCYDLLQNGTECYAVKKSNAIDWETKTNGCVEYKCDEEKGNITSSLCATDKMCINDGCFAEDSIEDKEWVVEIDVNNTNMEPIDVDEVTHEMSELTGISETDFVLGIEYDSEGRIIRVLLYVNDEKTANRVQDTVDGTPKGGCEQFRCRLMQARVREITHHSVSFSSAFRLHNDIVIGIISMVLAFIHL